MAQLAASGLPRAALARCHPYHAGRVRSGSLSTITHSISAVHGHPTPDSFRHLLVLRAVPLGGVAARAPAAAAAGHAGGARPVRGSTGAHGHAGTRAPPPLPTRTPRPPAAPAGEKIAIKTDLYTADVDTAGGVITQVALERASRHRRQVQAVSAAAEKCRSHIRRAVGPARRGPAQPPHALAGACRDRANWRPARTRSTSSCRRRAANGDKVVQTLTFHRGSYVIDVDYDDHQCRHRADRAVRVFPVHARHQVAERAELDGARRRTSVRSSTTKPTSSRRSNSASSTSSPPIRARKPPFTKNADNGWVGMVEHYFVAAWLPPDEPKTPREFYARKLDNGLYAAGVIVPVGTDRARRDRRHQVPLYVGPQDQDTLQDARQGSRPGRRLRHLHRDRGAAVLAAQVAARAGAQLGLGDRPADDHHQERVLSAEPRQRALDGQDEGDRAEAEGAAGAVRERQAAAAGQDDGDVQDREDQSARRLSADPRADPGVHRALLGAACPPSSCATRRGSAGSTICRRPTRTSCCRSSTRSPPICR